MHPALGTTGRTHANVDHCPKKCFAVPCTRKIQEKTNTVWATGNIDTKKIYNINTLKYSEPVKNLISQVRAFYEHKQKIVAKIWSQD